MSLVDGAFLVTWLAGSVRLAGPLLLAALGEIVAERAGVLNLGIEGTILLGALAAFLVDHATGSPWLAVPAAMLAGVLSNLLLAWMYVTVRASQVVTGIIFNVLALGAANYLNRTLMGDAAGPEGVPFLPRLDLPVLSDLPFVGPVLFSQPAMLYFTLAAVVAADRLLFRTHLGLDLRAVGENPRAAATAGIDVRRLRYLATLVSGASAAAAGAYFVVCEIGLFRDGMVAGRGFIALAIVILGRWNPYRAALAAFAFGAADALPLSLQMLDIGVPAQALLALPYVMTILVMSGLFGRARQPQALMTAYADD